MFRVLASSLWVALSPVAVFFAMPLVGRTRILSVEVRRVLLVLLWLAGVSTGGLAAIAVRIEPMQEWQANALRILLLDVCVSLVTWSLAATLSLLKRKGK